MLLVDVVWLMLLAEDVWLMLLVAVVGGCCFGWMLLVDVVG